MEKGNEQTVELFCGAKVFSNIAGALGFKTFTVDINPDVAPDLTADVRTVSPSGLPMRPLIVWAAPPDAAAFVNPGSWTTDGSFAATDAAAEEAIATFGKAVTLVALLKPTWWFIENPKSLLRKMPITAGFNRGYPSRIRHTIRHDQYGGNGAVETDVWTNAHWWKPGTAEAVPNSAVPRGRRVPPFVFSEIFAQLEQYREQTARGGGGGLRVADIAN